VSFFRLEADSMGESSPEDLPGGPSVKAYSSLVKPRAMQPSGSSISISILRKPNFFDVPGGCRLEIADWNVICAGRT
jgi:hypothetical protein